MMNRNILFRAASVFAFLLCLGQGQVSSQESEEGLISNVDHVVATLTSSQYKAINQFLSEQFPESWMAQGDTKGFMLSQSNNAYAELWNAAVWHQYGYQVAFSSPETGDAAARAAKRFNTEGVNWSEELFTAGADGAVGNPVGGTFLVHPGGMRSLAKDSGRIADFVELVTAVPKVRLKEKDNYQWFGVKPNDNKDGFTATDQRGFKVTAIGLSDKSVMSFGHVAMRFRLAKPVDAKEEITIPESGGAKAIFDEDQFWLILEPELFEEMKSKVE